MTIPSVVVDLVTLGLLGVGFAMGYAYRGWAERRDALEALQRAGITERVRQWLRETDRS